MPHMPYIQRIQLKMLDKLQNQLGNKDQAYTTMSKLLLSLNITQLQIALIGDLGVFNSNIKDCNYSIYRFRKLYSEPEAIAFIMWIAFMWFNSQKVLKRYSNSNFNNLVKEMKKFKMIVNRLDLPIHFNY